MKYTKEMIESMTESEFEDFMKTKEFEELIDEMFGTPTIEVQHLPNGVVLLPESEYEGDYYDTLSPEDIK